MSMGAEAVRGKYSDTVVRARRQLEHCAVPAEPWSTLADVQRATARVTGRTIGLHAMAMNSRVLHGMLVTTEDHDFIVYESGTSRLHQQHIILHELSHLIWGHEGRRFQLSDDSDAIAHGRTSFVETQEREAEIMASVLGQAIASPVGELYAEPHPALARLMSSFDPAARR